jgi:phospholipid transport system substrate-binding protein
MKKLTRYLAATVFVFTIAGLTHISCAQKSKSAVKNLLEKRNQQIKKIVGPKGTTYTQAQRQKLKKVINEVIDYQAMAKFALDNTWNKISSQQRKEFVNLFSTIVSDHSIQNLDIYRAHVRFLNISVKGDSASVKTLATEKDIRKRVDYQLHYNSPKGKWAVTDFSINDVSTAKSYRRQFQDIIQKNGFSKLMDTLRKRANQET